MNEGNSGETAKMNFHVKFQMNHRRSHLIKGVQRAIAEPLKFALVGISGIVFNILTFKLFISVGGSVGIAPMPAFLVAVTSNYFLNSHFTFNSTTKYYLSKTRYAAYFIGNLAGLGINLAVYYPLYFDGRVGPFAAQMLGIWVAAVFNFFAARTIIRWRRQK